MQPSNLLNPIVSEHRKGVIPCRSANRLRTITRKPALCGQRPIRKGAKVNQHHTVLGSEGGVETVEVHEHCHRKHHSGMNHFREWGRKGGIVTAARGWWIFNLKRGTLPPDPLRWIPFGYGQ
ncbi:MAG TPA: hypothetical protein VE715_20480 [Blastocatellia bacterium]|nr:hypothetical protein [Blastocatellia bacterium]